MNPLAQRKNKKKRKLSGVLFFIMENCICAMVASLGLWSGFCRPVISRVRGVSHHFSLHAKVGGVHFMFCVNNVLPQGGKEIH